MDWPLARSALISELMLMDKDCDCESDCDELSEIDSDSATAVERL